MNPLDSGTIDLSSALLRRAQAFVGVDYGAFFPVITASQWILSQIDGDPDKSAVLGNMVAPQASGASQHTLNSYLGHRLIMDDDHAAPSVILETAQQQNQCVLKETGIALWSHTGKMTLEAVGQMTYAAQQSIQILSQAQFSMAGESIEVSSQEAVAFQAKDTLIIEAAHTFHLSTSKNMQVIVAKTMQHTVEGSYRVDCLNQVNMNNEAGKTTIMATQLVITSPSSIVFKVGNSEVCFDSSGQITVKSRAIKISANDVNMQADRLNYA